MPKELFFTISETRRQTLIDASIEEFSNHLYFETSINQIIKNAKIARGSFYQYFVDKEDLYFYIINSILRTKIYEFMKKMDFSNRDIFYIYRKFFLFNLSILSDEKYHSFFKHLYLSMNFKFEQKFRDLVESIRNDLLKDNIKYLQESYSKNIPMFIELTKLLNLIILNLIRLKITDNISDKDILKIYDMRQDIISGKIKFNNSSVK